MRMADRFNRGNIAASLFLLGSLGLAVVVSFMLKGRSGAGGRALPFRVHFSLAQGAMGLKPGSHVLLGGQRVGQVVGVEFSRGSAGGREVATGVDVRVEVRSDLALYENASIALELPLIGTLSSLNISSVGDPAGVALAQGAGPQVEPDEVVSGVLAPPGILAQSGIGQEEIQGVRQAIRSFTTGVARANEIIESAGPKVQTAADDLGAIGRDMRASLDRWTKNLDAILGNAETASKKLDPLLAKADAGVDDARGAIADVRRLIGDNRERIDATIASVHSAAAKLDQTTMDQLGAALGDGRKALDSFAGAVDRLGVMVGEETPGLRRIIANLRLMSDQLKLTATEVRAQPWRLLVQPTTKEFESQVLYDATRSYAQAASDLRAASESLDAAMAGRPAGADGDREEIARLAGELKAAFGTYHEAEQALLDKLIVQRRK